MNLLLDYSMMPSLGGRESWENPTVVWMTRCLFANCSCFCVAVRVPATPAFEIFTWNDDCCYCS